MATSKSKEMVNVAKQLAAEAESIADAIGAPDTRAIKVNDKVFKLPNGQIIQSPLSIVIIDFISTNKFYANPYREGEVTAPVCFAMNKTVALLAPSNNSEKKQAKTCAVCPLNEFGSAGAGKACKNMRLLAVTLPETTDNSLYTLAVSPTAIKAFDGYIGSVAKAFKAPPVRVITEVMFHPEKTYPSLLFGNPQPNKQFAEDFARREEANTLLAIEPFISSDAKAKPKSRVRRK